MIGKFAAVASHLRVTEKGGLSTTPPGAAMQDAGIAGTAMDLLKGIGFKIISVMMMAVMSALIRKLGETTPVGQMVFFRSAFAILPVLLIYAWRGEIRAAAATALRD